MNYQEFKNRLFAEAEEGYRDFVLKGTITERPMLGVRIPKCRKIAKEVFDNFEGGAELFLKNDPVSFEEVMIRGMVIAKLPYEEMVEKMYDFIALMDNWGVCDCFCASMRKNIERNRDRFLNEIDKMLKSLDEYQARVAYVCLLDCYVVEEYLAVVFDRIDEVAEYLSDGPGEMSVERTKGETVGRRTKKVMAWDAYYVKMAIAWLISVCFVKFPEETMLWFERVNLPKWTYNKAISKTCESFRVGKDLKKELMNMKK